MIRRAWQRLHAALLSQRYGRYDRFMAPWKRELLGVLEGTIVEIGAGTGVNLPFFRPGVRWIGVEPNPFMHRRAREAAMESGIDAEILAGTADALPFESASVDAVVSTLVLCSVPDVDAALREARRVLRPGGCFVFIEHVAAPRTTALRRIQRVVRPAWRVMAGGCNPDRETWTHIEQAGFARLHLDHMRAPSGIVGPHIAGWGRA